ncbi:MAG: 3-phosphoglycerate dehydrogenase [Candidatus Thorarchaeota archaeon]|nr:3-phosphoglycerate dehydrogenase [Candidatus Thorarchaeota archaeon]
MGRVLLADAIDESAVARIKAAGHEIIVRNKEADGPIEEQIKGFDCVIVRSATKITREVIESADNLRLIVRAGVGLDNVDREAAKEKGIEVKNTPEAPTVSVAELVIAMMLALARNIAQADSSMKDGRWEKKKLTGTELQNKKLGIIGFGRIGRKVAAMAKSFDMDVLCYDVLDIDQVSADLGARRCSIEELIASADYITVHVPLVPQTKGMIGEKELKIMKKTAYLINAARGGIIDEKALLRALNNGDIAGAALDVYENEPPLDWELVKHPHVVATPHIASSTEEAQARVGELTADKVIAGLK